LFEVQRRKLQAEAYLANLYQPVPEMVKKHFGQVNERARNLKLETDQGQDSLALARWEVLVAEELTRQGEPPLPRAMKRNFVYGLYAGLGRAQYSAQLGQHFGPGFLVNWGFVLGYKRASLLLDVNLSGGRMARAYTGEVEWEVGQRFTLASFGPILAYDLSDSRRVKLVPMAGYGFIELARRDPNNPDYISDITGFGPTLGLRLDYKLEKRIKLATTILASQEYVETLLSVKLQWHRLQLAPDLAGNYIGITLGLAGIGNFVRVR
jgi:hypothetical protein